MGSCSLTISTSDSFGACALQVAKDLKRTEMIAYLERQGAVLVMSNV